MGMGISCFVMIGFILRLEDVAPIGGLIMSSALIVLGVGFISAGIFAEAYSRTKIRK